MILSGSGFFSILMLIIIGGLLIILLPVFAIVDILRNRKVKENEKVLWIILIIIIPILGSILYFFAGPQRRNK
ncbi:MAG: PLDc N-terminal domain-containing protein [Bacteroidota bacterium]